ncbi:MAG: hypothetical protein BM564_03430 [Bacteroidetes bacterium MedPE-SWsnd-G2]|nr:MAG: hypothetical protein BM564_03430 [Bacteroidetes bacterium MedPE-SWsnd-G2]
MKKLITIIVLTLCTSVTFAQDFSDLANQKLKKVDSYKPAETKVLECVNYLFETPFDKNDLNRAVAQAYIIQWMTGTPDHSFALDSNAMELTKGSTDLFALFMAAMTKVVLEQPNQKLSNEAIYKQAEALLVSYCSDSNNKLKPSKKIKKLIKATE